MSGPDFAPIHPRCRAVAAARAAAGLTQRALAAKMGCGQPYIARVERGEKVPSLDWLVALSREIRCRMDDLDPDLANRVACE